MMQRSYYRQPGQRLFLPSSYSAPRDGYFALEARALALAREFDVQLLYFPDSLSNAWQDSAGTTPATLAAQPIGFIGDQQYRAAGPELVVNGGFDSGSNWVLGSGASISGGVLSQTNTGAFCFQLITGLIPGRTYAVTFQIVQGQFFAGVWDTPPTNASLVAPTTYFTGNRRIEFVAPADGNAAFSFSTNVGGGNTSIMDNVSCREVLSEPNATALGPNFARNGNFLTDSEWTTRDSAGSTDEPSMRTVSAGVVTVTGSSPRLAQLHNLTAGRTYAFQADIVSTNCLPFLTFAAGVQDLTSAYLTAPSSGSSGVRTALWTSTVTGLVAIGVRSGTAGQFQVRNVSLRELPGYHATQPTAGNRPTLVQLPNGRWGMQFDGVNDNFNIPLRSTDANNGSMGGAFLLLSPSTAAAILTSRDLAQTIPVVNQLDLLAPTNELRLANRDNAGTLVANLANVATPLNSLQLASADAAAGVRRLFLNGTLRAQATQVLGAASPVQRFIGGHSATGGAFLNGVLAFVWDCPTALPDHARIAIERFAAAHAGAPYLG